MRHPAVNDDRLMHTLTDSVRHALDLGQHTARDDALCLVALDLGKLDLGDQRRFIVFVAEQADNIRHADELFRVQRNRNFSRRRVGVDVVGHAVLVHADRGDDRDKAVRQQVVDQRCVDPLDLAHKAEVGIGFAPAHDHVAVHAAKADTTPLEQRDKILVDLPGQHLLHNAHRFGIGIAQTVDEAGFLADLFEHIVDGRPAAVYQHHAHAQQRQRDKVVHDRKLEFIVDHGIAAVLDHQRLAVVFLNIRRSLAEKQGHLFVFHSSSNLLHGSYF